MFLNFIAVLTLKVESILRNTQSKNHVLPHYAKRLTEFSVPLYTKKDVICQGTDATIYSLEVMCEQTTNVFSACAISFYFELYSRHYYY